MDTTMMAAWLGFFGGVVVTVGATAWAYMKIEHSERRRLRVECVMNLIGARFVLDRSKDVTPEDRGRFNFELNKIPALFSEEDTVMEPYRMFAGDPGDISKIYPLIAPLMARVKIGKGLDKVDIERVLRA